ncbi:hypothetical protein CLUG_01591 [Clavispora lusitaniae ATCC 42720]|uniref:Crossover junction endonuclease MUS81-like HHH domain-containing protein n=1 Tax=Clavispora lusitaniae (strain ATCC 42720) TaxID=306902 RepID=C4Y059_CLAL4|nr:uncharacterized protein CLUG_01591 [Clavispora lusitaniae ATCC 42720]EEQ37468.1 hypothetical protein CLUG_01591 [Clavispora lusitaniae ATCC 42720]
MSDLNLNALFEEWLETKTNELIKKGSKLSHTYGKALQKIRSHQEPIVTSKQLRSIQFVGEKIFSLLCSMLKKYCIENDLSIPSGFSNHIIAGEGGKRNQELDDDNQKKKRRVTNWVPKTKIWIVGNFWYLYISMTESGKGLSKDDIISGCRHIS